MGISQSLYKNASLFALILTIDGTSASAQEAQVFSVSIGENYHIYPGKLIVREGGKAELYDSSDKLVGRLTEVKRQQIGGNHTCIFYANGQYGGCLVTGTNPLMSLFGSKRKPALPIAQLDEALNAAKRGNKKFALGFYHQAKKYLDEQRDEFNRKEQALLRELNK